MSLTRTPFKGMNFSNGTSNIFYIKLVYFKIYHKIVQLKQILSKLKYFQAWEDCYCMLRKSNS